MTTKKKSKKSPSPKKKHLPTGFFYVIRACRHDRTSYDGFRWPEAGPIKAPRFIRDGSCGNGLHGWYSLEDVGGDAAPGWFANCNITTYAWLIVKVPRTHNGKINYSRIDSDKVKFGYGEVVSCWYKEPLSAVRVFASLTKGGLRP